MSLLDVRNLNIGYQTRSGLTLAARDISFTLDRGRSLGLIGESGCGKTTIGMAILKLLPETAHVAGGRILFDGEDLVTASQNRMQAIRGNRIAMIFQAAMNSLNPVHRVGDQIAEALQVHSREMSRSQAMDRVKILFDQVGLKPERLSDFPHQFSGGMKQRAIIAMAMACSPDLIIADEPTTALDMVVQRQILTTLQAIQRERSIAMLTISHDMGVIAEVCHDIAVMAFGEIIEYGSREEILNAPAHPRTVALMASYLHMDRETVLPGFRKGLVLPAVTADDAGCPLFTSCSRADERCKTSRPDWKTLSPTHTVRCRC